MSDQDTLRSLLKDTHELEEFFHEFISQVTRRHPKPGEDVTRYAEELGLRVPAVLRGAPITWGGAEPVEEEEGNRVQTLVFLRPGNAAAIGLTLGCITWGRFRVCLECGWFYCRIVISGRF